MSRHGENERRRRPFRKPESVGKQVTLQGWIRTRRDSKGGFSFLELNDGSAQGNLQIVAPAALPNYEAEVKHLTVGCSVTITGEVKASPAKGQATEVHAASLVVLHTAGADPENVQAPEEGEAIPSSFSRGDRTSATADQHASGAPVARVRNQVCCSIHNFFQERGFLYVHPPIITASDCEGAGQMFRVTTLDPANPPKTDGNVDYTQDFFHRPSYLTVSGQLEAEIFACALGKVYTFGPTFRAENSNTSRHLAEFWMIEPEMAFFDLNDNMDLAEAFIKRVVTDALAKCTEDMDFFNERIEKGIIERLKHVRDTPFVRLTYTDAVAILEKSGQTFEYSVKWGADLQVEHERYLTEKHFKGPVILFDYPKAIKSFYMRVNEDGKTVRAMDVLVPSVGEIIGGSQREERLDVLEARMKEMGLNPEAYWWYLDLRKYGTVPHSGFGLGLERTVQFVTGMANIRDVIPFPRVPGNADF